jgi:hypothetical protein
VARHRTHRRQQRPSLRPRIRHGLRRPKFEHTELTVRGCATPSGSALRT